jgi:hypothetical protein
MVAATSLAAATALVFPVTAQANWQPWTNLGGETLYSGPGFRYVGQVFSRNAAGNLIIRDPVTGVWQVIAGPALDRPAVLPARFGPSNPDGPAVEIFYRSPDSRVRSINVFYLCHVFVGCGWASNGFGDAAGAVTSTPDAVYLLPNRIDLFARGTNGRLQHTWQYGSYDQPWAVWEDLGGISFVESPSAVSWWDGNRLDVFVKGGDAHLKHLFWTSTQGWSAWEDLGGTLTSAPSAIVFDGNRLDIFAKGTSDTLIHKIWTATGGWSGWEDLGGRFQYSPAVVKSGSRIDVYVTGSTAQLEHIWWG